MRRTSILLLCAGLLGCGGNKSDEAEGEATNSVTEAVNEVTEAVQQATASIVASFGGNVIKADDYFVEVLPRQDGQIEAVVKKGDGTMVEGDAGLVVKVKGEGDATIDVPMVWDPTRSTFVGAVDGRLETGDVEVAVEVDGETHTGTAASVAAAPAPALGGTILVAGDMSAEIKTHADGTIDAYILDAGGALLEKDAEATISVKVKGSDDELHAVALAWSEEKGLWTGTFTAEGDVTLVPGPMEFSVDIDGEADVGRVEEIAVATAPTHGGQIVVAGDFDVELVAKGEADLEAYVTNRAGAAVDADTNLTLVLDDKPVDFVWNAEASVFKPVAEATIDVDVRAVPIGVVVMRGAHRFQGGIVACAEPPKERVARGRARFQARARARASRPNPPGLAIGLRGDVPPGLQGRINGQVRGEGRADVRSSAMGSAMIARPEVPMANVRARGTAGLMAAAKRAADVRVQIPRPPSVMASVMASAGSSGGSSAMTTTTMREASGSAMAGFSLMGGFMVGN